jgi:pilus assembly protein CpaE
LRVVAAPPRPEMADKVNADQFSKLLIYLRQMFAYVVVDTCCYLTDVVQAALEASNLIVLITTQDIPSIKNCSAFLSLADASGIKRQRILFAMNRFDKRIAISPERVGESLRQEIVVTIPFEDRVVSTAVNQGVPFMVNNKTSLPGKGIYQLADAIRERLTKEETEETPARK